MRVDAPAWRAPAGKVLGTLEQEMAAEVRRAREGNEGPANAQFAVTRAVVTGWLGQLVVHIVAAVVEQTTLMVVLDRTVQAVQIDVLHTRGSYDSGLTKQAALAGAVGGALAVPFAKLGHVAGEYLDGALRKAVGGVGGAPKLWVSGAAAGVGGLAAAGLHGATTGVLVYAASGP